MAADDLEERVLTLERSVAAVLNTLKTLDAVKISIEAGRARVGRWMVQILSPLVVLAVMAVWHQIVESTRASEVQAVAVVAAQAAAQAALKDAAIVAAAVVDAAAVRAKALKDETRDSR